MDGMRPVPAMRGEGSKDPRPRFRVYQKGGSESMSEWKNLGGSLTDRPTAVVDKEGAIHVFVRGKDNALYHIWQEQPGNDIWSPFQRMQFNPAYDGLLGAPTAAANDDGRLEVFYWGINHRLCNWWQVQDGRWSGTNVLGGAPAGIPAVIMNKYRCLEVFFRETDGSIHQFWQPHPSDDAWKNSPTLGSGFVGDPAVGMNSDDWVVVFALRGDNALYYSRQVNPPDGWDGWSTLGGSFVGTPAVGRNLNRRLEVFARGTDNTLYHCWQTSPTGWSEWTCLGDTLVSDPAVIDNQDGRLEVFGRGRDGAVYHTHQLATLGDWSEWTPLGGECIQGPIAARNTDGRLEVFIGARDGTLQAIRQATPNGDWNSRLIKAQTT